jgi:hypothetical protein
MYILYAYPDITQGDSHAGSGTKAIISPALEEHCDTTSSGTGIR